MRGQVRQNRDCKRPQDWGLEDRLRAVLEAEKLTGQKRGVFLRSRGLHSKHLEEWREEALSEAAKRPRGRPRKDPELAAAQKLNKALQRESPATGIDR